MGKDDMTKKSIDNLSSLVCLCKGIDGFSES